MSAKLQDEITAEFWMLSVDACRKGVPFSYAAGSYGAGDNAVRARAARLLRAAPCSSYYYCGFPSISAVPRALPLFFCSHHAPCSPPFVSPRGHRSSCSSITTTGAWR
jgi:hypothetical protein